VLEPFVTGVIGLDVSDNMIAKFNSDARGAGVSPEKMLGLKGDLLAETIPEDLTAPEFFNFDLVVISMALHHFASPELAMQRLGSRLKKGGVFLVIDLVPYGEMRHFQHHHPDTGATITRDGFSSDEIRKLYADAGVDANFNHIVLEEPLEFTKGGHTYKPFVFMARGERV
jgi:SAM-dependent methyltransferase